MGKERRLFLGRQNELCDCWWRALGVASWTARSGLPMEGAHLYPSLRLVWGCPWDGEVCRSAVSIHQSIGSIRNKQWARVALYLGWFVGRAVDCDGSIISRARLAGEGWPTLANIRSDAKPPPLRQCASSTVPVLRRRVWSCSKPSTSKDLIQNQTCSINLTQNLTQKLCLRKTSLAINSHYFFALLIRFPTRLDLLHNSLSSERDCERALLGCQPTFKFQSKDDRMNSYPKPTFALILSMFYSTLAKNKNSY